MGDKLLTACRTDSMSCQPIVNQWASRVPPLFVCFVSAVMADINKPISITDEVLKEGSGDVNKLVSDANELIKAGLAFWPLFSDP